MMSRTSEGQSWREAADGEEEDSTVQGGCGNEVRNDVLETDKRPGAKAREGALNRVEKIKGKKRGSTGEGHESDTRQDKEEGERMEQESSRQHTHKHARRHPHAHQSRFHRPRAGRPGSGDVGGSCDPGSPQTCAGRGCSPR